MSENGPVDVKKQTIHAIIPGLDTKAAKRIDKLRRLTIVGFSIVIGVGFGGYGLAYLLGQFNVVTATIIAIIVLAVYFMIANLKNIKMADRIIMIPSHVIAWTAPSR